MIKPKIKNLQKIASEYRDEYLLECLQEGKNSYEPEAYAVLLNEAKKRNLIIEEKYFYDEVEDRYIKLIKVFETDDQAEADHVTSLLSANNIYFESYINASADTETTEQKLDIFVIKNAKAPADDIIDRYLEDMGY